MTHNRYSMSFTTGTLFHQESITLAALFFEFKDWDSVRNKVLNDNLLQARTLNTSRRVCREIISRLKTLSTQELDILISGSTQEQAYLLWLAVCRRYKFIADFSIEVLRERFLSMNTHIGHEDFDSFFNKKSEWHPELDGISPATRNKLRQVLFKMLHEADLINSENTINAAILSPRLLKEIASRNDLGILLFPALETTIKQSAS